MARKTILVSDVTGEEIPDEQVAKVVVTHGRDRYELDVDFRDGPVADLVSHTSKRAARGRRPKS
jgi:hypothetical protein